MIRDISFYRLSLTSTDERMKKLMKFSARKKAKIRKVRFDRNKREWSNFDFRSIEGETVVDKISIQQIIYLLTEKEYSYSIFRVGANGELTRLTPKKIRGNRSSFQKSTKWFNNTKVVINDKGEIVNIYKKPEPRYGFAIRIVIPLE